MEALLSGTPDASTSTAPADDGSLPHESMVGSVEVDVEDEDTAIVDSRSVYVGNVRPYAAAVS